MTTGSPVTGSPRKKGLPGTQYMIPDRRGTVGPLREPGGHVSIMVRCGFQTV